MKTLKTQFGTASTADFEEHTWTFEMPVKFEVCAGKFAIVDKLVYDNLLEALQEVQVFLGHIQPKIGEQAFNIIDEIVENAIKKITT